MSESVIVELATIIAGVLIALISGYFGWRKAQAETRKRIAAEKETVEVKAKLNLATRLKLYEHIRDEITRMQTTTNLDRWLMLVAHNGRDAPTHTTAVVQIRDGEQAVYRFEEFRLDDHYRQLLRVLKNEGWIYVKTEDIPDGTAIKGVYRDLEGVTASYWGFISSVDVGNGISEITYFSHSTHHESGELSQREIAWNGSLRDMLAAQAARDSS